MSGKIKSAREVVISDQQVEVLFYQGDIVLENLAKVHKEYRQLEVELITFETQSISHIKDEIKSREDGELYLASQDKELKNEIQRKSAAAEALKNEVTYNDLRATLKSYEIKRIKLQHNLNLAKVERERISNALISWRSKMEVVAGLSFEGHQELKLKFNINPEV